MRTPAPQKFHTRTSQKPNLAEDLAELHSFKDPTLAAVTLSSFFSPLDSEISERPPPNPREKIWSFKVRGDDSWRLESYRVRIKGLRKNEGNKATNELWRYITQARFFAYQTPYNSWCMACNCSCGWKSPSQILLQTFGQINNPEIPLIRWSSLYKLPFGVTSLGIRVPCNGSKPTG